MEQSVYVVRTSSDGNIHATTSLTSALVRAEDWVVDNTDSGLSEATYEKYNDIGIYETTPYNRAAVRKLVNEKWLVTVYVNKETVEIEKF